MKPGYIFLFFPKLVLFIFHVNFVDYYITLKMKTDLI